MEGKKGFDIEKLNKKTKSKRKSYFEEKNYNMGWCILLAEC